MVGGYESEERFGKGKEIPMLSMGWLSVTMLGIGEVKRWLGLKV